MSRPIMKREYVQEFTKGHGTYTVREQHLARDLERAYTMIEDLRDRSTGWRLRAELSAIVVGVSISGKSNS